MRVRGACRQKEKPQSKNYERPPPALVVPGASPRAQLVGGRGRMENIHPSCLKCTSRFFSSGQLRLTFSSVVLAMAWGDFHCRDGKRRVRARRVAAGQSACHPRRWGGQEMRAVRIMVVSRRFSGTYVWRGASEYSSCLGCPVFGPLNSIRKINYFFLD